MKSTFVLLSIVFTGIFAFSLAKIVSKKISILIKKIITFVLELKGFKNEK